MFNGEIIFHLKTILKGCVSKSERVEADYGQVQRWKKFVDVSTILSRDIKYNTRKRL